jgi:hypothetical protein
VVSIAAPTNGATLPAGHAVALAGSATDAEDGDLSTAIVWTSDRDGTLGSGSALMALLSEGAHVLTATVTDGLGAVRSATAAVQVVDTPPVVSIIEPGDGSTFAAGGPVMLRASAVDAEDGDLSAAIAWASDRDGMLGLGASVTVSGLSSGAHILTATVMDGGGQTGVASAGIMVVATQGLAFGATADAFAVETSPTSRFGASAHLIVNASGPAIQVFVRFTVSGTVGLGTQRAVVRLRLDTSPSAGSPAGGAIHAISETGWNELLLTYQNRPPIDGPVLDTVGAVVPGEFVEFDVTEAVDGDGTYVFAIVGTVSDSVVYRSRETGADGPRLVLDLQ